MSNFFYYLIPRTLESVGLTLRVAKHNIVQSLKKNEKNIDNCVDSLQLIQF